MPRGYKIWIVGHSLGAAAASLLGVMLRSRIPSLRNDDGTRLEVLAFASPPVLDYDNAIACAPFCTTIVNNSDIIPRASLANLMVGLELLKNVNSKLEEKGLDYAKNGSALIRKLAEGSNSELLMEASEFVAMRDKVMDQVELRDPDHLYVPGKTLILYDKFKKKPNGKQGDKDAENGNDETTAEGLVLSKDGTCAVLRMVLLDDRSITDHLSPSYRSSIKALLTPEPA